MLQMRINSLKKVLNQYAPTISDSKFKPIIEDVMNNLFDHGADFFFPMQEKLSNIGILGQIFSRQMTQLFNDSPSIELFYKLQVLAQFGKIMIAQLSDMPFDQITQSNLPPNLDEKKFTLLQEQMRSIKKEKNKTITTIDGILKYILEHAFKEYPDIQNAKSWSTLLSYIYGVNVEDDTRGAKEIEHINIKELLLSYEFGGNLITEIYCKYDGLLTYTMSLLTMITGTSHSEEFSPKLNRILEALGSSTKITLFQGRIKKMIERRATILQEIKQIQIDLFKRCKFTNVELPNNTVKKFFDALILPQEFDLNPKNLPAITTFPEYASIFGYHQLQRQKEQINEVWAGAKMNLMEIHTALVDLNEFFASVIRNANDITADLFSKGFQAAIPLHDVNACETAGIHIKNITATSSTIKVVIPEEYFDTKLKLLRRFEAEWQLLSQILRQKCQEESMYSALDQTLKVFNDLFNLIQGQIADWQKRKNFDHYGEEVVLSARMLYTAYDYVHNLHLLLMTVQKMAFCSENLDNHLPFIQDITAKLPVMKQFGELVLLISEISKKIWMIKREHPLTIGKDPSFILEPEKIEALIKDVPTTLKREFMQKLIPAEVRSTKMDYYNRLLVDIASLKKMPQEQRALLLPYESIIIIE